MQWPLVKHRHLITRLIYTEIVGRYRGSLLGILWSLLTPLLMLAIYTWVFGVVFKSHWSGSDTEVPFAVLLFAGLIVFGVFSEVMNRSPGLIVNNANYVKRVVFPLEILPVVTLGASMFHAGVNVLVLLAFALLTLGHIPPSALYAPLVWAPFLVLVLGLSWFLAALGVYLRDISQILGTVVTAMMFLSPIFYPSTALSESVRPFLAFNPVALPVEETRNVLIFGHAPNWTALGVYAAVSLIIACLGYAWFQTTKNGFADVL